MPGMPGRDGLEGRDGLPGATGAAGRDGIDGKDGAAGRDGLGFDDLSVVQESDESRAVILRFSRGDQVREFVLAIPGFVYRGVYAAGTSYDKGDAVTFGGSLWIARSVTAEKPGDGATAWRLAVKAGRDGREGKAGPAGPPGPRGERGEPGRLLR